MNKQNKNIDNEIICDRMVSREEDFSTYHISIERRNKAMECPECSKEMSQLCMYGTDEDINIDYHCENCNTLATLHWTPSKRKTNTIYSV